MASSAGIFWETPATIKVATDTGLTSSTVIPVTPVAGQSAPSVSVLKTTSAGSLKIGSVSSDTVTV